MRNQRQALQAAVKIAGGVNALARELIQNGTPISRQAVHKWMTAGRVPDSRCEAVAEICGGRVTVEELRGYE